MICDGNRLGAALALKVRDIKVQVRGIGVGRRIRRQVAVVEVKDVLNARAAQLGGLCHAVVRRRRREAPDLHVNLVVGNAGFTEFVYAPFDAVLHHPHRVNSGISVNGAVLHGLLAPLVPLVNPAVVVKHGGVYPAPPRTVSRDAEPRIHLQLRVLRLDGAVQVVVEVRELFGQPSLQFAALPYERVARLRFVLCRVIGGPGLRGRGVPVGASVLKLFFKISITVEVRSAGGDLVQNRLFHGRLKSRVVEIVQKNPRPLRLDAAQDDAVVGV